MEDERGAGGLSDSGGVSEPPLSGKLADASVADNTCRDNRVEEVFEEGDGEEIMVEVVGLDVFVDGVGGNGKGDGEMAETGELKGGLVGKREEDGDKMNEGGLGSSESRDEKHDVAEVDTSLSMSIGVTEKVGASPVRGVGGVDDEASNCGIKAVDASVKEVNEPPLGVAGVSPMDISEEKEAKGEAVDKDVSDSVKPDSDEKIDVVEEKEISLLTDNFTSHDCVAVRDEVKCPSADNESDLQGKSILENNVGAAESKDSIPKPNAPADVPNLQEKDVSVGASHAGSESIRENSFDIQKEETIGNNECSKAEDDIEGNKSKNEVTTSTPITDGADAVELDKDKHLDVEVKDDAEENVQNKPSMSGSTDGEIVQLNPGICSDQPIISSTVGVGTGDPNVVFPSVKDVDMGETGAKGMEIDSVNFGKSLACHGSVEIPKQVDSAENITLPDGARSEVETSVAMVTEDPVPCHYLTSEGVGVRIQIVVMA